MAYSDFKTLSQATAAFGLTVHNRSGLFGQIPQIDPSPRLLEDIHADLDLAITIDTEKARSELLITPVFREIRSRYPGRLSFFSGSTLNVDASLGLNGECDFILSASANQVEITVPVVTVVEAKNADTKLGLGQCVAQMVGAARFNADSNQQLNPRKMTLWGATTTGDRWRLLSLSDTDLSIDLTEYVVPYSLPLILGFLSSPFEEPAVMTPLPV